MDAAAEGVKEARPEGFGDKNLHVGVASVEPGSGAIRGFYGGQDYLKSQLELGGRGRPGRLDPQAVRAGGRHQGGLLPQGHLRRQQPDQHRRAPTSRTRATGPTAAVNMIKATEDSINTAFIDLTDSIPNGPEKVIKMMNAMGIPPQKAPRRSAGFPNRTPGLEPNVGVALGSATVSPINMATAYATIANKGVHAAPYLIEKIVDRDGEKVYTHHGKNKRVLDEDMAADVSYAMQQVIRTGSGSDANALGRPAAGKTGTSTNDDGRVVSSWFSGFTPQLATSVVYVRGKGAEPLDDWLPSALRRRVPDGDLDRGDDPGDGGQGGPRPARPPCTSTARRPAGPRAVRPPPPKPTKKPSKPSDKPTKKPTKKPSKEPTPTPEPPPPPVTTRADDPAAGDPDRPGPDRADRRPRSPVVGGAERR